MVNSLLERLLQMLEEEQRSPKLNRVPPSLYHEVASRLKALRAQAKGGQALPHQVANRESALIHRLATRLLDIRLAKFHGGGDEGQLTPEERYLSEPVQLARRRRERLSNALRLGQSAVLEAVVAHVAAQYTLVRFREATPALVGTDLAHYGPFEKEDVALLPTENVKPLVKQGVATEIWSEPG